eukprot:TRINITY_DN12796_c0_g1_i1.p1 TRINITY_DN12796_c0_g1~~TRINITY_DN12796_c0_g1_i1.p1  ORF type:complete len:126 (-),score=19.23 TRINITY_DN12796_c0_g1_i1:45-422(-)
MVVGYTPFRGADDRQTFNLILDGRFRFAAFVDRCTRSFVSRLLLQDPDTRLGDPSSGLDIRRHAWFRSIPWLTLDERPGLGPFVPPLAHAGDTRHFSATLDGPWREDDTQPAQDLYGKLFSEFPY